MPRAHKSVPDNPRAFNSTLFTPQGVQVELRQRTRPVDRCQGAEAVVLDRVRAQVEGPQAPVHVQDLRQTYTGGTQQLVSAEVKKGYRPVDDLQ